MVTSANDLSEENQQVKKDSQRNRTHRFFASNLPDQAPRRVELSNVEAHHARDVLRVKAGQKVELFDGCGVIATACVTGVSRGAVALEVESVKRTSRSAPAITLAFAVPKGKRLDWLLEKATELGAAAIRPIVFDRSVAGGDSLSDASRERWLGHCVSAAKQCGLNFLPEIHQPTKLETFLQEDTTAIRLLGDLSEDAIPIAKSALADDNDEPSIMLLIGPEGGLSDPERQAALAAGFQAVRLGETTLRTETAAIAMLAAVLATTK